jgi:hypothetical protein
MGRGSLLYGILVRCLSMRPKAPAILARIEKEFGRIGLLLQHDRELASFTTLVAGQPIGGSWWGHPLGHDIYDLLGEFERGSGALSAKLVSGKITYVHPRLWPAFLRLAQHDEDARALGLSPWAMSLRKLVLEKHLVRADELVASKFATSRVLSRAVRELEERVLVHTDSLHTATGAHTKVLEAWSRWAASNNVDGSRCSLTKATAELAQAVDRLREGSSRRPRVPLLTGAA